MANRKKRRSNTTPREEQQQQQHRQKRKVKHEEKKTLKEKETASRENTKTTKEKKTPTRENTAAATTTTRAEKTPRRRAKIPTRGEKKENTQFTTSETATLLIFRKTGNHLQQQKDPKRSTSNKAEGERRERGRGGGKAPTTDIVALLEGKDAEAELRIEDEHIDFLNWLINPLDKQRFLQDIYAKKACLIQNRGASTIQHFNEVSMHSLKLKDLLKHTPSEQFFVWMPQLKQQSEEKTAAATSTPTTAAVAAPPAIGKQLNSFEVSDIDAAIACHNAGASLYFRSIIIIASFSLLPFIPPLSLSLSLFFCWLHHLFTRISLSLSPFFYLTRAPSNVCDRLVRLVSTGLSLNFGSSYPNGDHRGEVETFISRKGHVTDWHFDFMQNFTIQLKGKVRTFYAIPSSFPSSFLYTFAV